MADRAAIQNMSDKELMVFCKSVGIAVQNDWDRERLMRALVSAMYEASGLKVAK